MIVARVASRGGLTSGIEAEFAGTMSDGVGKVRDIALRAEEVEALTSKMPMGVPEAIHAAASEVVAAAPASFIDGALTSSTNSVGT